MKKGQQCILRLRADGRVVVVVEYKRNYIWLMKKTANPDSGSSEFDRASDRAFVTLLLNSVS